MIYLAAKYLTGGCAVMAVDIKIEVTGITDALNSSKATRGRLLAGVNNAVNKIGLLLLREAKLRAPHDVGDLIRSARFKRDGADGVVAFRSDYAAIVHEDPRANPAVKQVTHGQDYNIKHAADIAMGRKYWYKNRMRKYHTRRPQEAWKFLENPARENVAKFSAIATSEITTALLKE